ncbi:band 4.1-like protein 4 [Liolophura sinensis]|uniref:band 4.1-like protein 4 n=1 Tax=Liolophura sinensis TaxID=3198878 RepID=UPI0031595391
MSFRISKLLPKFLRGEKDRGKTPENTNDPKNQVLLLDDTELTVHLKHSHKGSALLERVFEQLNLVEKDFFGLRFIDQYNQTHWLDGNKSIATQIKGSQNNKFYFGVKFYAADPCKLHEEITRYQFFLQVKRDILQGRLPVSFDEAVELCAYAVQSELGDFDPKRHTVGYVSEFQLLPNQTEELEDRIAGVHRELVGMVPAVAEYRYLEKVKWLDMYGVDLHPVLGEGHTEYFLGLTPMGIVVYKNKSQVASYLWPRITKVTFKAKVFTVRVKDKHNEEHPYSFELSTKSACKHLWKCCVEHHAFFSTRMEKLLNQAGQYRQPPQVLRIPSRRHNRRSNSDSRLDALVFSQLWFISVTARSSNEGIYEATKRPVTMVITPEPVQPPRYSYRQLPESPQSTRSAPWETRSERRGLYTSGRESPLSVRSEKMKFPHRRPASGSESETGPRRRYYSSRKSSDNESEISHTRRRRRKDESGSESEAGYRRTLRQRRAKSAGEDLFGADWRNGAYIERGKENIPNGSLYSLHGDEERKRRRRRTRSKSPSKRPPEELRQHFEYGLIETEGLSEDQLREIPYTQVETKAEPFRVKAKYRYKSPKRRSTLSNGEASDLNSRQSDGTITQEEAPPPYVPITSATLTRPSVSQNNAHNVNYSNSFSKPSQESNHGPPSVVYRHESYTTSPKSRNAPLSTLQPSTHSITHPHHPSRGSRYLESGAKMQLPPSSSENMTHSPYWGGRESRERPTDQRYPPTSRNQQQRYNHGYHQTQSYPLNSSRENSNHGNTALWNGREHPYYQSPVDNVDNEQRPSTHMTPENLGQSQSEGQGGGYKSAPLSEINRPEVDQSRPAPQHYRTPSDNRYQTPTYQRPNGSGYSTGRHQAPPHNPASSQAPAVHRPVYAWSHFQPVKPSASPASQSNNSTMGSSHSEITHHVISASGRHEKWTEL